MLKPESITQSQNWKYGDGMKPDNLTYEIINGRYIIGYFDDGWHFYKEVSSEEEAKAICNPVKRKSRKRNGDAKS